MRATYYTGRYALTSPPVDRARRGARRARESRQSSRLDVDIRTPTIGTDVWGLGAGRGHGGLRQVRRLTDGGRRLVQDEQLTPAHDRAREGEDLALADGQVRAASRDLAVECDSGLVILVLQAEQAGGTERVIQDCVIVLREGVEVLAQRATQELRLARTVS